MTKYTAWATMLILAAAWTWPAQGQGTRKQSPRPPGLEAQEAPGPDDHGGPPAGGPPGMPGLPRLTQSQMAALRAMNEAGAPLQQAVNEARNNLNMAIYANKSDPADIRAKVEKLAAAELAHATARADAFAKLQGSPD